ncbi:hypothetical protein ABIE91_001409 [Bradyrhizobium elkanii]
MPTLAIGKVQPDAVAVLVKSAAAAAEMQVPRRSSCECVDQHAVKVAAMHHPVGRAVDRARGGAEVEQFPGPPGAEQPDLLARGLAGDRLHLLLEPERDEDAGAVGAELDTGAELAQLRRLLEDLDFDATLQQRQSGDEAADPGAGDQHFWLEVCIHTNIAICA